MLGGEVEAAMVQRQDVIDRNQQPDEAERVDHRVGAVAGRAMAHQGAEGFAAGGRPQHDRQHAQHQVEQEVQARAGKIRDQREEQEDQANQAG